MLMSEIPHKMKATITTGQEGSIQSPKKIVGKLRRKSGSIL